MVGLPLGRLSCGSSRHSRDVGNGDTGGVKVVAHQDRTAEWLDGVRFVLQGHPGVDRRLVLSADDGPDRVGSTMGSDRLSQGDCAAGRGWAAQQLCTRSACRSSRRSYQLVATSRRSQDRGSRYLPRLDIDSPSNGAGDRAPTPVRQANTWSASEQLPRATARAPGTRDHRYRAIGKRRPARTRVA